MYVHALYMYICTYFFLERRNKENSYINIFREINVIRGDGLFSLDRKSKKTVKSFVPFFMTEIKNIAKFTFNTEDDFSSVEIWQKVHDQTDLSNHLFQFFWREVVKKS